MKGVLVIFFIIVISQVSCSGHRDVSDTKPHVQHHPNKVSSSKKMVKIDGERIKPLLVKIQGES